MLVAAAAQKWGIAPDACSTENGYVLETGKRRKLGYGELTVAAAAMPVPEDGHAQGPEGLQAHRQAGQAARPQGQGERHGRLRHRRAHRPGMLVAVVARAPVLGATVDRLRRQAGARRARREAGGAGRQRRGRGGHRLLGGHEGPRGAAGRRGARARWPASTAPASRRSSKALSAKPGVTARHDGDPAGALRRAAKRVEATYEVPYLAHATMEPMNCTAWVRGRQVHVWAPTQFQSGGGLGVQGIAAKLTGLAGSAVTVHTTFLGGGFGRRFELDFVIDAVQVSKAIGRPVKVIWSREDDMPHDFYRPASYSKLAAGLDAAGKPVAWSQTIVCPSIMSRFARCSGRCRTASTPVAVEGVANMRLRHPQPPLRVGQRRPRRAGRLLALGRQLAERVRRRGVHGRAGARGGRGSVRVPPGPPGQAPPRHRGVLELAATKAGWGTPLPAGRGRGHRGGGVVRQLCRRGGRGVGRERQGPGARVVCAVDCGRGRQSRHRRGADGGRRRLRPDRRALRRRSR